MIGQERLQGVFKALITNKTFPRFCILTGQTGIGKKTLANWIATEMHINWSVKLYELPDVKIDTIREMIDMSYKATDIMVYIIPDADSMSPAAKNSLLKITEEPPNKAYFIMTLENPDMTLDTVKSRASMFSLDNYSEEEIREYALRYSGKAGANNKGDLDIIKEICDVPGDVDMAYRYNPTDFYRYVEKVVDNIGEAEEANVFKISEKLALKPDSEGYDLKLFLRIFLTICFNRMTTNPLKYATAISITGKYISQLGIRGVSKQMLVDAWILEIRKYWVR